MAIVGPVSADGKLLGTSGLLSIQGSSGGGLTPWAVIAGYGEDTQFGGAASVAYVNVDDFSLRNVGAAIGVYNRVEISLAQNQLTSEGPTLKTQIVGAKVKLYGDLVYDKWPQVSLGAQHISNRIDDVLRALDVQQKSGTDLYLSASKLWLDGPFHRQWLASGNLRSSRSTQEGLLGFDRSRRWQMDGTIAVLLNRKIALGLEYRGKQGSSKRLSGQTTRAPFEEDAWRNVFLAYFPNHHFSVAAAYVDLGKINSAKDQRGVFLTVQGTW